MSTRSAVFSKRMHRRWSQRSTSWRQKPKPNSSDAVIAPTYSLWAPGDRRSGTGVGLGRSPASLGRRHAGPALERTMEITRLGEPHEEGDLREREALREITQREITPQVVANLLERRAGVTQPAL